jgi:hypothetical protein
MNNLPSNRRPRRKITKFDKFVRLSGMTFGVFFLLLGLAIVLFLVNPNNNDISYAAKLIFITTEYVFAIIGSFLVAIFWEE